MSTEEEPRPQTRAEARALREAAEREAAEAEAVDAGAEAVDATEDAAAAPAANAPAELSPEPEATVEPEPAAESEPEAEPAPGSAAEPERELAAEADPEPAAEPASEPAAPAASTGPSQPARSPRAARPVRTALLATVGILALTGAALAAVSLTQGPRISAVQVNPAEAIEASGSRVVITANEALAEVDPTQVTVEPAVPFTVDAAGRGLGIRFTVPLDDATKYTVRVAKVAGANGGPTSALETSFTTPASEIFLLRRDVDGDDIIFRTGLSGEQAVPVFRADEINDYRTTATKLIVATQDAKGSHVLVMNRQGKNAHELELPGDGYVSAVQVSERGNLVGYTYSDRELTETSGRASVLVTQSLAAKAKPVVMTLGGVEVSVAEWQFVPDSAAVLFIDFDGSLALSDLSGDAGAQALDKAATLAGISRGTYTAIVENAKGEIVQYNLADGTTTPLAASTPDYGVATTITPFPGGTLRHVIQRDESGLPTGQAIIRVDDAGAATVVSEVDGSSAIIQSCVSPSGQYAAVVVAKDLTNNPYDTLLLPLPQKLQTQLIDLRDGKKLPTLTGFDASWCAVAPSF